MGRGPGKYADRASFLLPGGGEGGRRPDEGAHSTPLWSNRLSGRNAPPHTCTFLLAVLLYDEPFSTAHAVSFGLIWAALVIYSLDLRARLRSDPDLDTAESPAVPLLED